MIIVYVAHPIGGDVARNIKLVESECSRIFKAMPEVVPIAPYLFALMRFSGQGSLIYLLFQ